MTWQVIGKKEDQDRGNRQHPHWEQIITEKKIFAGADGQLEIRKEWSTDTRAALTETTASLISQAKIRVRFSGCETSTYHWGTFKHILSTARPKVLHCGHIRIMTVDHHLFICSAHNLLPLRRKTEHCMGEHVNSTSSNWVEGADTQVQHDR